MTRNQIFVLLILVGLATGSGFYLAQPLLKPSQLLPLISLAFLPLGLVQNRLRYDRLALWISLYILVASLYNLPELEKDQLIDFGFILSTFLVYVAAVLSAEMMGEGDRFPAKVILRIFLVLLALYLWQVTTDFQLVPEAAAEDGVYGTTFNNSNDLNSFIVAFIPLILYCIQLWKPGKQVTVAVFLALAVWVVVLGSRSCIAALFIIPAMFLIFSASYLWKLILLSGTGFVAVLLSQLNWENILRFFAQSESPAISRSATRLALALFDIENDKSASYRVDSYLYAINHASDAVFGLGTKNYDSFFQPGFGEGSLVASVPHSYLVENMIAFGWLGLLLVALMLASCLFGLLKDRTLLFYGLTSFVLFLIVSFVPSTIIRLPILWFPLFFFTHLASHQYVRFGENERSEGEFEYG